MSSNIFSDLFSRITSLYPIDNSSEANEIVEDIITSWNSEPEKWEVSDSTARLKELQLWIGNAPYADMCIGTIRLPQLPRLRLELNKLKMRRAKSILYPSTNVI